MGYLPNAILVAWYWASPLMLALAAVVAVPWLLHLWSRQRYDEMPWAAMQLLTAAIRRSRRRLQVENWLLLALRTLLVVGVACAAAEPRPTALSTGPGPTQVVHRVLVVDVSYSMAFEASSVTALDQAKAAARELIALGRPGDTVSLVLMSDRPRVVLSLARGDAASTLDQLEDIECEDTTIDVPAACRSVERLLEKASPLFSRGARHEVYFLTDMRRIGWTRAGDPTAAGRGEAVGVGPALARLAQQAPLTFLRMGDATAPETSTSDENAAVTDLHAIRPATLVETEISFVARVRLFGSAAKRRYPVEWRVDGRPVERAAIDLPPDGFAESTLSYRFVEPGIHTIEVRIPDDALAVDNRRWLVVDVRPRLEVLVVEPSTADGSPGRFLRVALEPDRAAAGDDLPPPSFRAHPLSDGRFAGHDLTPYDCIVFCDIPRFTRAEVDRLREYFEEGGGAVFFPGPNGDAANYNERLVEAGASDAGLPILPARLGPVEKNDHYRVDPLDYAHPIVASFRDNERSGLLTTPVDRYRRLLPRDATGVEVIARLPGGAPLAVEGPAGRGRVVLVATGADTAWSPLPLWPSFVPLVHEMVYYACQGRFGGHNLRVGDPLAGEVPVSWEDQPVMVLLPDGTTSAAGRNRRDGIEQFHFDQTSRAGVYRAAPVDQATPGEANSTHRAEPGAESEDALYFAVNCDTAESDPTVLSLDSFRANVLGPVEARVTSGAVPPGAAADGGGAESAGNPWVHWIVGALLVLVVLEVIAARRLEGGRAPQPDRRSPSATVGKRPPGDPPGADVGAFVTTPDQRPQEMRGQS